MDRTREFLLFAEATNVPQRERRRRVEAGSALIAAIEADVRAAEQHAAQKRGLHQEAVRRAEANLRELFALQLGDSESELQRNILLSIRRKHASLSLRLSQLLREEQRKVAMAELDRAPARVPPSPRESLSAQPEHLQLAVHKEEISTIRKRELETIESHINELGKMVTEVSMHISMQGERLQRVDELFSSSRRSIKKASFELNHALAAVSQRRRTMLLVFGVLFGLLLLRLLW